MFVLTFSNFLIVIVGFVLCGFAMLIAEMSFLRKWDLKKLFYLFFTLSFIGIIITGVFSLNTSLEWMGHLLYFCIGILLGSVSYYLEFYKVKRDV